MSITLQYRPEHFAEIRDGKMACANCDQILGPGVNILCPKAPRTAHGIDRRLYTTDPVYYKLVTQGRMWRREMSAGYARRRLLPLTPEEYARLYTFTADDWAARYTDPWLWEQRRREERP